MKNKFWAVLSFKMTFQITLFLILKIMFLGCNPETESLYEGVCGDGVLNKGEECDLGTYNSDILPDTCRTDCLLPYCGDMVLDTGETCDGSDLGGSTCLDLGYLEGKLKCGDDCEYDVSECSTCGDGYVSGREQCDGEDLDGMNCEDMGFSGGTLLCGADCNFDFSQCTGGCGNGVREENEDCDKEDLAGKTCENIGFESGSLACNEKCKFDKTGCIGGCGNGIIEDGEICDDGNDIDYDGCSDCRAGDSTFRIGDFYRTCDVPQDLVVTDLNSNGHSDLIVACAGQPGEGGGLTVHLNGGNGTFDASQFYSLDVTLTGVSTGDVDGDGIPDVAASFITIQGAENEYGGALVMKGNGDGTLDASRPSPAGTRPMDIALGDFNGNGFLDCALADVAEQRIQILEGDGNGAFVLETFLYTFGSPTIVETADVDLDGKTDILTVRQIYDIGVMYLGLGNGVFSSPISRRVGDRPNGVAVGHFNGDSYPDVVFSNAGDGRLSTLVGLGSGEFAYPIHFELEPGITGVLSAPLDKDPYGDLIVLGGSTDKIWTVLGNGDGSFHGPHSEIQTCDSPIAGVLSDFDFDKIWDVAVICSFSNEVAIHLGNEAQAP